MKGLRQKIKQFLLSGTFAIPVDYLQKHGVKVGTGCNISPCHLSTSEGFLIEIGDYCRIAANVEFFTHGMIHAVRLIYNDPELDYFGKIKIGNYVSIGEGSKILAGVNIGNNVIIGAGSVVSKSIPDGFIVAGNPARHVGYTDDWYRRIKEKDLKTGKMPIEEKKTFLLTLPDEAFIQKSVLKTMN
jgi:acetyltransferase-like isoleucine patch superfamily enzyme